MKWALPTLFLLLCLFLVAFPAPLRPEEELKPAWNVDLDSTPIKTAAGGSATELIPFELGDRFGYVSETGNLVFHDRKIYGVAIDSQRFINFSSVSGNLLVEDPGGNVVDNLEISGYPILRDGRFFVISTNRSEIAEIDESGAQSWRRELASIITDLDARADLLALGLLDGRAEVLNHSGAVVRQLEFFGSRIGAVYGCSLSNDGRLLAVVHGIDPQYVSVADLGEDGGEPSQVELDTEFRTTRRVSFVDRDRYLLVEDRGGIMLLDVERGDLFRIRTAGSLVSSGELEGDGLVWTISTSSDASELLVVHLPDKVIFRLPFTAEAGPAHARGNQLIFGVDHYVGMLRRLER